MWQTHGFLTKIIDKWWVFPHGFVFLQRGNQSFECHLTLSKQREIPISQYLLLLGTVSD
jgi:hypothetical protein